MLKLTNHNLIRKNNSSKICRKRLYKSFMKVQNTTDFECIKTFESYLYIKYREFFTES